MCVGRLTVYTARIMHANIHRAIMYFGGGTPSWRGHASSAHVYRIRIHNVLFYISGRVLLLYFAVYALHSTAIQTKSGIISKRTTTRKNLSLIIHFHRLRTQSVVVVFLFFHSFAGFLQAPCVLLRHVYGCYFRWSHYYGAPTASVRPHTCGIVIESLLRRW